LLVELDVTHQVEDFLSLFAETFEDRNGLVGHPDWVGTSRVTFVRDAWSLFWGVNYIGKSSNEEKFGRDFVIYREVNYDAVLGTGTVWYHNFSASYQWDNGLMMLAGVSNAFDENPPQLTRQGVGTDQYSMIGNSVLVSQYDMYGRRFFVNLTMNF
jgi:iron complex outermembrane receptor protein